MAQLTPEYIVVHTAAFSGRNCDRDTIDRWHRDRGWNGIGYHYVVVNDKHDTLADGTVQEGRSLALPGAHTQGINSRSIGICCVGHGDREEFTGPQLNSLVELISGLIDQYEALTVDRVIGHRDINELIARGLVPTQYRTTKSCPGVLVSMEAIRRAVGGFRTAPPPVAEHVRDLPNDEAVREALAVLERARGRFANAGDELDVFLTHPEVLELRGA